MNNQRNQKFVADNISLYLNNHFRSKSINSVGHTP
jgi:hypothetical protein